MGTDNSTHIMLCTGCGAQNPAEAVDCNACGKPFPARPLPPKMEKGYFRLQQAAYDLVRGQLTMAEFGAILDQKMAGCQAQLEMFSQMPMDATVQREMAEQMAIGVGGIHRYVEGLELMKSYLTARNLSALEEGLAKIKQASDLLNLALTKNWQAYYDHKEALEEVMPQLQQAMQNLPGKDNPA